MRNILVFTIIFFAINTAYSNTTFTDSTAINKDKVTKIRLGSLLDVDIVDNGEDIIVRRNKISESRRYYNKQEANSTEDGKIKYRFYPNWAGISLGLNNFMGKNFSGMPSNADFLKVNTNKALEVNLNIWQIGVPIFRNYIGLGTGVGFKFNNFVFRNNQVRLHSDSTILYHTFDNISKTIKNKLTVCYVQVPLFLEFQIPINKYGQRLYIANGIEAGLKIGAYTKIKNEDKKKIKNKNDFYLSPYSVDYFIRLGYQDFGIYASYSLLPLFEKNKAPDLHTYSIGFTYNF